MIEIHDPELVKLLRWDKTNVKPIKYSCLCGCEDHLYIDIKYNDLFRFDCFGEPNFNKPLFQWVSDLPVKDEYRIFCCDNCDSLSIEDKIKLLETQSFIKDLDEYMNNYSNDDPTGVDDLKF